MGLIKKKCAWCGVKKDDLHSRVVPGVGKLLLCTSCKSNHDKAAKKPKSISGSDSGRSKMEYDANGRHIPKPVQAMGTIRRR